MANTQHMKINSICRKQIIQKKCDKLLKLIDKHKKKGDWDLLGRTLKKYVELKEYEALKDYGIECDQFLKKVHSLLKNSEPLESPSADKKQEKCLIFRSKKNSGQYRSDDIMNNLQSVERNPSFICQEICGDGNYSHFQKACKHYKANTSNASNYQLQNYPKYQKQFDYSYPSQSNLNQVTTLQQLHDIQVLLMATLLLTLKLREEEKRRKDSKNQNIQEEAKCPWKYSENVKNSFLKGCNMQRRKEKNLRRYNWVQNSEKENFKLSSHFKKSELPLPYHQNTITSFQKRERLPCDSEDKINKMNYFIRQMNRMKNLMNTPAVESKSRPYKYYLVRRKLPSRKELGKLKKMNDKNTQTDFLSSQFSKISRLSTQKFSREPVSSLMKTPKISHQLKSQISIEQFSKEPILSKQISKASSQLSSQPSPSLAYSSHVIPLISHKSQVHEKSQISLTSKKSLSNEKLKFFEIKDKKEFVEQNHLKSDYSVEVLTDIEEDNVVVGDNLKEDGDDENNIEDKKVRRRKTLRMKKPII